MTAARPLDRVRILSLALNLPGPAALMRCRRLGARCTKLEPPAPQDAPAGSSGDPMARYDPAAYAELHEGIKVAACDLKTDAGRQQLARALEKADVLLTSFRPSALERLGLGWAELHTRHPSLCHVAIVGAPGSRAEQPGHDLTYQAEHDLVAGLELPPTLHADMAGALLATEAVLQAALLQAERYAGSGEVHPVGRFFEVALSDAAAWLAVPRRWGLAGPQGTVGGAHAGYRVYACRDGRVAVAALEPHFAAALCAEAGVADHGAAAMASGDTHAAIAAFFAVRTRDELERLAVRRDIPLHTLAP